MENRKGWDLHERVWPETLWHVWMTEIWTFCSTLHCVAAVLTALRLWILLRFEHIKPVYFVFGVESVWRSFLLIWDETFANVTMCRCQVYANEPTIYTLFLLAWSKKQNRFECWSLIIYTFSLRNIFDIEIYHETTPLNILLNHHLLHYIWVIIQLHMWGYPVLLFVLFRWFVCGWWKKRHKKTKSLAPGWRWFK